MTSHVPLMKGFETSLISDAHPVNLFLEADLNCSVQKRQTTVPPIWCPREKELKNTV